MAFVHGKGSHISVDGTDISQYTDTTDQQQTQETAEVTAFGDDDKNFIAGLKDGTFSLGGHFDATADGVLAACFDGATVELIYGPAGNGAGSPKYTAQCIVTSYQQSSPVGDKVGWSASFQRSGALVRGTF